jgi:hypothetical protein
VRGGSALGAVAALAAAVLAGCGQAPVTNPLPDPPPPPAQAELRSFRFPSSLNNGLPEDCAGLIDGAEVDAEVPFGTGRGCLVAEFEAEAERVLVGDEEQVSGACPQDYSSPLPYTLVGEDGEPREYTVHVSARWADAFDREDSPEVGNGWTEIEPGTADKAEASLAGGALVMEGCMGDPSLSATVRRDFPAPLPRPYRVAARFRRDLGGVLSVKLSDSTLTDSRSFMLDGIKLYVYRNGTTKLGEQPVAFDYDCTYTLVCSVDPGSLSVSLVDGTGGTQTLACADPSPTSGFTRVEIIGGKYFGEFNCRTFIDGVELSSPCCP